MGQRDEDHSDQQKDQGLKQIKQTKMKGPLQLILNKLIKKLTTLKRAIFSFIVSGRQSCEERVFNAVVLFSTVPYNDKFDFIYTKNSTCRKMSGV
jgi:hypothetical protein